MLMNVAKMKLSLNCEYHLLASDIENKYDPSYDYVGEYEIIVSLNEFQTRLSTLHVNLEQFINSSEDDEYPL